MIFLCFELTTLLFFSQKLCCIGNFVLVLYLFFGKNRKKSANFLQFFLVDTQQVRRILKKNLLKTLDKIFNCCIFALCLELNKTTTRQ